jgi:hypothetical protein
MRSQSTGLKDMVLMSYDWSAVGGQTRAHALQPGGLVLVHDFVVDEAREGPPFAAWYLLGSMFDNPTAVCLTPSYVDQALGDAGKVRGAQIMLPGSRC